MLIKMSEAKELERKIKKIDFLRTIGANPERKIEDIAKELSVSHASAYRWLQEFIENAVMTDNEPDFPRKLLLYYNKGLPDGEEGMARSDVDQLRGYVEDYYEKNLPRTIPDKETINTDNHEQTSRTMSQNNPFDASQFVRKDVSTDSGLLRTLLMNAKFVHPSVIDRFIEQYEMNKVNFDKEPLSLLEYMKHVFSNAQGEQIWSIFQKSRGRYVYGADGQAKPAGGMDPMQMMMMMGMMGGGFNPSMIPMMQQGGDPNMMMNAMMMGMMQQKAAKEEAKQAQAEQFERITQTLMLKMVGGSIDDKRPYFDQMGMGMGGMMGPPTMREVLDEGGRVKARDYIPNFQGQTQPGNDPMSVMMMGKLMDANTQLMMKATDSSKTPLEILTTMIPFFKDQGNAATQLAGIMDTVNKVAPGFFERRNEPQGGLEVYKLKFDTELAMQAQKIELAKMEHMWEVDKMDKQASADNAKNWLQMIQTFGSNIVEKVGPAIVDGFAGKGKGGPGGAQPQYSPEQMAAIIRARQMQAQQQAQEQQMQQQQQQAQVSSQPAQPQPDLSTMYLITNLQNALNESEKQKQMLIQKINEIQSQPPQQAQQQQYQIDEKRLAQMPTQQLKEILQELSMQNNAEKGLETKIESILANRALMSSEPAQPQAQSDMVDMEGQPEPESVSSEQTRSEEESHSE